MTWSNPEDSAADAVLFLAAEDYIRMRGRSPVEFQIFQLWFLACPCCGLCDGTQNIVAVTLSLMAELQAFASAR